MLIDFDGVLHSYVSGWKGVDVIPDPPLPGAIQWLEAMMDRFDVSIFSARCNEPEGILAMRHWFAVNGMDTAKLHALHFEPGKPSAFMIIDDRAMQFTGTFPDPEEVADTRPWYYGRMPWMAHR